MIVFEHSARRRIVPWHLLLIVFVGIFVFFWRLGDFPFRPSDESLHVKAAQSMLQTGEWWLPRVDGEPYFRKPPLKMWLSLLPVSILGESTFSYRFLDAFLGLMTCIVVYVVGTRWFSPLVGLWAAMALMGCRYFVIFHGARSAVQDSMIVFLAAVSMPIGWKLIEELRGSARPTEIRRWMLSIGLLVGFGILVKSVAGALPAIVIGFTVLPFTRLILQRGKLGVLLLIAAMSVLPALYFVPHLLWTPSAWETFFGEEVYGRFRDGMHNSRVSWFYLTGLFSYRSAVPPELLALGTFAALIVWWREKRSVIGYLLIWSWLPVILYGNLSSRMPWYIAPAFPAMSLLCAWFVVLLFVQPFQKGRIFFRSLALLGMGAIVIHLAVVLLQIAAPPAEPFSMQRNYHEEPNWNFSEGIKNVLEGRGATLLSTDRFARAVLNWEQQTHTRAVVSAVALPKFAQHESIAISFLGERWKTADDSAAPFRVMPMERLVQIPLESFQSYFIFPPENRMSRFSWHRRHAPLIAVARDIVEGFQPVVSLRNAADPSTEVLYGLGEPGRTSALRFRPTVGSRFAVMLAGDRALRALGARVELQLTQVGQDVAVAQTIFNDQVLPGCEWVTEDRCQFVVPGEAWNLTSNVLSVALTKGGGELGVREGAFLVSDIVVRLGAKH